MSVIPCHRGGHHCAWPACALDCDGRPGAAIRDGIDDGPDLPRWVINGWKRDRIMIEWKAGATLRALAQKYEVSHETVRDWTENEPRAVGASRRPRSARK